MKNRMETVIADVPAIHICHCGHDPQSSAPNCTGYRVRPGMTARSLTLNLLHAKANKLTKPFATGTALLKTPGQMGCSSSPAPGGARGLGGVGEEGP